jgi:chaperonin cofactor prefoldin
VREIESQALVAQQQIGLARTQMTSKQREQRLVKLTMNEMATLPSDAVVYEGVGKMYVPFSCRNMHPTGLSTVAPGPMSDCFCTLI